MTRSALLPILAMSLGALACSGAPGPAPAILPPPDDVPPIPRYIATVATNDFARGKTLESAEADADLIERAFTQRLGFDAHPDLRLRNDDATTDTIRALVGPGGALAELPQTSMVVLYIALHGQAGACNTDERCGRLWTRDAKAVHQALAVEDLLDEVAKNGPNHVIVLLDTCHGGLALRTALKPLDYAVLIGDRPGQRRSRKVLTAAGPLQIADDGKGPRPGRFAEVLLDALDGDADLVADGRLVFTELALYMQAEVRRRSASGQEPEFGGFADDGRGAPVLGGLRLPFVDGDASGALLAETHQSIDREEYRAARRHLARLMQARRHRALVARRRLQDALRLADEGHGAQAVELLGEQAQQQEAILGADHPAVAVTRQLRAELARRSALPAQQVGRLEREAAMASRAVSDAAQSPTGRVMAADTLGGVALAGGAPGLATELAAQAKAAAGDEAACVEVLAANEAVSAAAAGDTTRAEAVQSEAREAVVDTAPPTTAGSNADDLPAAHRPRLTATDGLSVAVMSRQEITVRLEEINERLKSGALLRKVDVDTLAAIDRTHPGYYEANRLLAGLYFQLKDYKRQSNALEEATRRGRYKHDPAILLSLAKSYAGQEEYGKALRTMGRVERKTRHLSTRQKADSYQFHAEMFEYEFMRQYVDDPKRANWKLVDKAITKWEAYRTFSQGSDPSAVSKANQMIGKLSGFKRDLKP